MATVPAEEVYAQVYAIVQEAAECGTVVFENVLNPAVARLLSEAGVLIDSSAEERILAVDPEACLEYLKRRERAVLAEMVRLEPGMLLYLMR